MDCDSAARDAFVVARSLCVCLCLAIAAAGQAAPPPASTAADQKCTIEGKVTNSQTSELVRKANLHLYPSTKDGGFGTGSNTTGFVATSQSDGTFRFEGLEPGEYRLSGERAGFVYTQYGSKGAFGAGTALALQPGQHLTNINLALTPQGVISGKVLDDDGDPMGQVSVRLLSRSWMRGKEVYFPMGQNSTNEQGEFRISNLSPGKYYLSAGKDNYMSVSYTHLTLPTILLV